jgi:hypothetical protein
MKKLFLLSLASVFAAVAFPGCAARQFDAGTSNIEWSMPVPPGQSTNSVHDVVLASARDRGWEILADNSGALELHHKGQSAVVTYDSSAVSVRQTGGDRNVMGWVKGLGEVIRRKFAEGGSLSQGAAPNGGRSSDGLAF